MPSVRASVAVAGPEETVMALWHDVRRWPNFVDEFAAVVRMDEDWPASGRLVWQSTQHGSGQTRETAVAPGVMDVETEQLRGRRTVRFADGALQVALDYELKASNPVFGFFVKRALRDSLRRTLRRFEVERRSDAEGY